VEVMTHARMPAEYDFLTGSRSLGLVGKCAHSGRH
jgi:hypothetical protein